MIIMIIRIIAILITALRAPQTRGEQMGGEEPLPRRRRPSSSCRAVPAAVQRRNDGSRGGESIDAEGCATRGRKSGSEVHKHKSRRRDTVRALPRRRDKALVGRLGTKETLAALLEVLNGQRLLIDRAQDVGARAQTRPRAGGRRRALAFGRRASVSGASTRVRVRASVSARKRA